MTSFQSSPVNISNTVSSAIGKVLKFVGGVPESKLNSPPNSCMPSKANISINRKRRNSKDIMERIELSREMTRLRNEDQYFVTLNIRSRRRARNTERPKEPPFTSDQITSKMEPEITTQSKRLNADSKYILGPSAYTLINISVKNRPRNTYSA
uniref:Uncharacterized protein n=1 Tax=Photinus pyralis TaxID=7054 RepID=A0A1Y1LV91_PHOPY